MRKLAFFSALCFFLSAVEYAVPKPVPFFRIGLANLPVMLSFLCMTKKESALLILLKVILQAFISGTLFSYIFLFSLAGSLASGFAMMGTFSLLYSRKLVSWTGISMAGGLANNLAQLGVAYLLLFGENTKLVAPVLLVISFFSSSVMGIFAEHFIADSVWLKKLKAGEFIFAANKADVMEDEYKKTEPLTLKKTLCLVFIAALFAILFFSKSVYVTAGVFLISVTACFIKNGKVRLLPSIVIILSVSFFSILVPYGKVILEIGKLKITEGALLSGLNRSLKLCGCVFLSKMITGRGIKLPSKAGIFIGLVFEYFEKLSEKNSRCKLSLKKLIPALDKKLESVYFC